MSRLRAAIFIIYWRSLLKRNLSIWSKQKKKLQRDMVSVKCDLWLILQTDVKQKCSSDLAHFERRGPSNSIAVSVNHGHGILCIYVDQDQGEAIKWPLITHQRKKSWACNTTFRGSHSWMLTLGMAPQILFPGCFICATIFQVLHIIF